MNEYIYHFCSQQHLSGDKISMTDGIISRPTMVLTMEDYHSVKEAIGSLKPRTGTEGMTVLSLSLLHVVKHEV